MTAVQGGVKTKKYIKIYKHNLGVFNEKHTKKKQEMDSPRQTKNWREKKRQKENEEDKEKKKKVQKPALNLRRCFKLINLERKRKKKRNTKKRLCSEKKCQEYLKKKKKDKIVSRRRLSYIRFGL